MLVFPSLDDAAAYKSKQEASGMSCTILSFIGSYYVTCVFPLSCVNTNGCVSKC